MSSQRSWGLLDYWRKMRLWALLLRIKASLLSAVYLNTAFQYFIYQVYVVIQFATSDKVNFLMKCLP